MMRFLSRLFLGLCPCVVSVCDVVVVPYVDYEVAVTVMRVLLFVLHVCMLRECEDARVMAMVVGDGGDVVVVSEGHVCGTRGSGIVSSIADVLWMSVVRSMRGIDGVCEMFMCLARGGVGGEGVSG